MSSATDPFDIVEVIRRCVAIDLPTAPERDLCWGDRAADRVRSWADAFQAQVRFELTLPRPLPDPEPGADGDGQAEATTGDAGPDAVPDDAATASAEPAGADDEQLPSLGDAPDPHESPAERARKERRSFLLSALTAFAEALRAGRITTAHVDTLAAAIDRLPTAIRDRVLARGDELLTAACTTTPERFSRVVQRVIARGYNDEGIDRAAAQRARSGLRRGVDDATKMHWLRVDLDPERGGLLFKRLDDEREAIFHGGHHTGLTSEQVDLQALLNLLHTPASATAQPATAAPTTTPRAQKSSTKKLHGLVLIDVETLLGGAHDRTVCETGTGVPLPPDTVRRLLCLAEVTYGLLINGRVVASVVKNDLATAEQRHELRMMYRTCCHPDCNRPFDHCQVHHIIARSRHGPTDTALMVPLCTEHHDLIHHRGWTLTIHTDRTLTWTAPNGTTRISPHTPLADLDRLDQPTLFDNTARPPPAA